MSAGITRAVAVALAAAAVALAGAPAAAYADGSANVATAVGGSLLAGTGIVAPSGPGVPPLPTDLASSSWLVADMTTGAVLAAKDPHGRFLPASTLKVLTALTLIPRLDPATKVAPTEADAGVDGTKVGLVPNFPYTVGQLFTAMLVDSANDAADTLATAYGGIPATLAAMNAEAHQLQADDTWAGTPSGLDAPGESSSAYDLALIARAAMALPAFRGYVQTRRAFIPAPGGSHIEIDTHNYLLTTYPGDLGVKNGYTIAAQATYIGAATRGGHTILITLMHATPDFWPEARSLLDWGFAADGKVTPVGRLVRPLPTGPPAGTSAATRLVAAPRRRPEAAAASGLGTVPAALGVVGAVVLALGNLRRIVLRRLRRRRRWRSSQTGPRRSNPPVKVR